MDANELKSTGSKAIGKETIFFLIRLRPKLDIQFRILALALSEPNFLKLIQLPLKESQGGQIGPTTFEALWGPKYTPSIKS